MTKYQPNELLNAIIICLPDGFIASDECGKITFVNETIERITGWNFDELIGQKVSKVFTLPEGLLGKASNHKGVAKLQVAILNRRDGRKVTLKARQVEIKGTLPNEQPNTFKGYLTIFHTEDNLDSSVDRAQVEFVSTVSHELRTPLTSIKGFIDTLLRMNDKLSEENKKKYMTIVRDQADRLIRLVEDLLAVSRLESQTHKLEIRSVDLKRYIDKVCESLSSKSREHKIVKNIEENIPNVWADADRLEQILTNLIDNAIKYSSGGTTVTINACSVKNKQGVKDRLKIEVIDEGQGIDGNDIPKIFTKFGRLDSPLTRQTEGTGLGLFITKALVLALKGEISVSSKPGKTLFTVLLPAVIPTKAIPLSYLEADVEGEAK